ncbi:Peroxiredoxin [Pedobacter sp. ok626]|uniref:TlpA disulfide reductase family protein n=1 Tax=Pedobacter sp. ok626 TaxID=1761882 RepID=UPI00088010F9|nr:TlpA disulfide reductase family protein [Pedobacter sp. ok626]SDJ51286.1 Peroxiredoxin [Pedobacter sp. ok626]
MKRIIISLLVLCPVVLSAQSNFTIKGKVSGPMTALKKVYLNYNDGTAGRTDSVEIKNAEFEISGTMKDGNYNSATLAIGNSQSRRPDRQLTLFIKKGERITVDVQGALPDSKITGSVQTELYQVMRDSLSGTKDVDQSLLILKRLIVQYPDSRMAFRTFLNIFGTGQVQRFPTKFPEIANLFSLFSPQIQGSKEGLAYSKYLENVRHLVIGGTLSDFTSKTPEGKVVKLSDLRGKYVLVDFWASWCIPCRGEFPYLKKAYTRFKDKNFEILGYSIDHDKSLWISALENDDVPWINVSNILGPEDPIAREYQIYAVPANFLIDPNGKVIATNLRGELLESTLEKFIK